MKNLTLAAALALLSAPAFAESHASGNAEAGMEAFERQCVSCHVVADGDTILAGRSADTGPNLFMVAGRVPGSVEGFEYGESLVEYGALGVVWDEETFVAYVQDPTDFLREALDNRRARGKMAFQVRDEQEAHDIYAYLVSLAPAAQ
jgi:cytochrome c